MERLEWKSQFKKKHHQLTFGFIAWDRNDTLLFDVQLQLWVAASHVLSLVVDAQDNPVTQPPATGHRALQRQNKKPGSFVVTKRSTK